MRELKGGKDKRGSLKDKGEKRGRGRRTHIAGESDENGGRGSDSGTNSRRVFSHRDWRERKGRNFLTQARGGILVALNTSRPG